MPTSEGDIRAAGIRCTAQRIAVLDTLRADRRHFRADEVAAVVSRRLGAISVQAVYDALSTLVGVGLARRIDSAGTAALFEARCGDNHHHIVCRGCGLAVDVDCVVGSAPCLEASDAAGFVIDEAEVTFRGLCPACAACAAASPASPGD